MSTLSYSLAGDERDAIIIENVTVLFIITTEDMKCME